MSKVKLDKMSAEELADLQIEIEQALEQRDEEKRLAAKEAIDTILRETGYTLDQLYGKGWKRTPVPKYRNPDNPSETYGGRGKRPKWLADKLAAGAKLDDFLIK